MRFRPRRLAMDAEQALLLTLLAVIEFASPWRSAGRAATLVLAAILTARFVGQSVRHFRLAAGVRAVLRTRFLELALTAAALVLLLSKASVWARELADPTSQTAIEFAYRQYAIGFLIVAGLRTVTGTFSVRRVLHRLHLRPAQTVALGFAAAILAGTLLLSMPLSVTRLEDLSVLNALFTATSAVTVTGLIVVDTATFYTPVGQVVVLGLLQLGGLGTMAASASLVVLAGRRLRLRQAAAVQESAELRTLGEVKGRLRAIVGMTVAAEATGFVALYLLWHGRPEIEAPAFAALFHAVSAFCNAGFSTLSTNLLAFQADAATSAVVAVLIVLGGLGFPVLRETGRLARGLLRRSRAPLFTLHERLTLTTTALLLAGGALAGLVLEWHGTLASLGWPLRLVAAGFLSVTARTAGFNTLDTAALAPATLWLLMVLMFVGGSPGSTAGGIKTTTAATVVATLWTTVQGRERVEAFRRTIPAEQVQKALALVGVALGTVAGGVVMLLATQVGDPLALTFEAVSAFGTVGLSTGLTPTLNVWGKLVIIGLMFVGRTGPLTLGFALAARARPARVSYPAEKIMIG